MTRKRSHFRRRSPIDRRAKARLDTRDRPDGYNVGVNVGPAAGQTVMHVHVDLIPRHTGDVPAPRGGVRNVIPGKGDYTAPTDEHRAGE